MDAVRLAMKQAARQFGARDGTFNSAGFGVALCRIAGLAERGLDGHLVRAILCGRRDVDELPGGAHWRVRNTSERPWEDGGGG